MTLRRHLRGEKEVIGCIGPGSGRVHNGPPQDSGTSVLELIIALVALIFLGIILLPFGRCSWEKAQLSGRLAELRQARDLVEKYIDHNGDAPLTLQTAYDTFEPGKDRPQSLFYCATGGEAGGSSECRGVDPDNPPGASVPRDVTGAFYILATDRPLAPQCHSIDMAWTTCCERTPEIVRLEGSASD